MEKSSANLVKAKLTPTTREKIAQCVCCGAERDEVKNGKPRFNSDHSFTVHRSKCKKKHASQFDPIHEHSVAAVNSAVADGETFVHSDQPLPEQHHSEERQEQAETLEIKYVPVQHDAEIDGKLERKPS